jgi:uncharacterized protein
MDKNEVIDKLIAYKLELSKHITLKKMILFGSYSKNEQRPDSDIDVAIVVDKIQDDYLNFLALVWKLRAKIDSRIEPVVFEENQPDYSGFFDTIEKTGLEIKEYVL